MDEKRIGNSRDLGTAEEDISLFDSLRFPLSTQKESTFPFDLSVSVSMESLPNFGWPVNFIGKCDLLSKHYMLECL